MMMMVGGGGGGGGGGGDKKRSRQRVHEAGYQYGCTWVLPCIQLLCDIGKATQLLESLITHLANEEESRTSLPPGSVPVKWGEKRKAAGTNSVAGIVLVP